MHRAQRDRIAAGTRDALGPGGHTVRIADAGVARATRRIHLQRQAPAPRRVLADRLGSHTAFLGLALVGAAAFALVALIMPETRREVAR